MNFTNVESICTIVANNYYASAKTLCDSFIEFHPNGHCYILIADTYFNELYHDTDTITHIDLKDLHIINIKEISFKYNVLEFCTALKPSFLNYLLSKKSIHKLIYLDPDIFITNSLAPLFNYLDNSAILLTPHLDTDFPVDNKMPTDSHIMKSGIFNLGFIGIRHCIHSFSFLNWWKDKLKDKCIIDHENGYFVDQKFIDLAFVLFEDIDIVKDTGFNVAYWNLHSRRVNYVNGNWMCNNGKLYFFHFSGYCPTSPHNISKFQNRFDLETNNSLAHLFSIYRQKLLENNFRSTRDSPYSFSKYNNGKTISDAERKLYRKLSRSLNIRDPFVYAQFPLSFKLKKFILKIKLFLRNTNP